MNKRSLAALLVVVICGPAYGFTGNTIVYDDADENSFSRFAAACGNGGGYLSQDSFAHGGTMAMAVQRMDNDGVGWAGPQTYSASSDYDGVVFWFNSGQIATTTTSFGVSDSVGNQHFLHLEDIYGGPLPAATWIRFAIPFSSPYFQINGYTPPTDFDFFCVINHTSSSMQNFMYVDDVSLTGADIFKNGFQP